MRIKNLFVLTVIALLLASLSGCANMNQAECEAANWRAIGYEDGVLGNRDTQFSQHRKECSAHGITANIDEYLEGHEEGSKKYCTQSNGFFLGMKGRDYNRNCPEDLAPVFINGLADGKRIYTAEKAMNSADDALERLYARIENFEELIEDKNNLMIADGLVRAERLEIRQQVDSFEAQMYELIEQIPQYQEEHRRAIENYEDIKRSFANYF